MEGEISARELVACQLGRSAAAQVRDNEMASRISRMVNAYHDRILDDRAKNGCDLPVIHVDFLLNHLS